MVDYHALALTFFPYSQLLYLAFALSPRSILFAPVEINGKWVPPSNPFPR